MWLTVAGSKFFGPLWCLIFSQGMNLDKIELIYSYNQTLLQLVFYSYYFLILIVILIVDLILIVLFIVVVWSLQAK